MDPRRTRPLQENSSRGSPGRTLLPPNPGVFGGLLVCGASASQHVGFWGLGAKRKASVVINDSSASRSRWLTSRYSLRPPRGMDDSPTVLHKVKEHSRTGPSLSSKRGRQRLFSRASFFKTMLYCIARFMLAIRHSESIEKRLGNVAQAPTGRTKTCLTCAKTYSSSRRNWRPGSRRAFPRTAFTRRVPHLPTKSLKRHAWKMSFPSTPTGPPQARIRQTRGRILKFCGNAC